MATKKTKTTPALRLVGKPAVDRLYQLRIVLDKIYPEIWRRVLVPGTIRLSGLHDVIQIVMGWGHGHPHEFHIRREIYGDLDPEQLFGVEVNDECAFGLAEVVRSSRARFRYLYDFGDCWWHTIKVERVLPHDGGRCPICTAGERNGVPEDCGGLGGYANVLDGLANPKNPEHAELLDWVGGSYDPAHFDIEGINRMLAKMRT